MGERTKIKGFSFHIPKSPLLLPKGRTFQPPDFLSLKPKTTMLLIFCIHRRARLDVCLSHFLSHPTPTTLFLFPSFCPPKLCLPLPFHVSFPIIFYRGFVNCRFLQLGQNLLPNPVGFYARFWLLLVLLTLLSHFEAEKSDG